MAVKVYEYSSRVCWCPALNPLYIFSWLSPLFNKKKLHMFELKLLLGADKSGNSCVFIWESSERCRHHHFTLPGALAPRLSLLMIDCATAGWPTVKRVSRQRRRLLSCWRDCLPWITSLIAGRSKRFHQASIWQAHYRICIGKLL